MEISQRNVEVWKQSFRRKYHGDIVGLRNLADQISSEAGEMVTITATSVDGGSGQGTVTGNKLEMLAAAEDLIVELDPSSASAAASAQPVRVIYPVFVNFPH